MPRLVLQLALGVNPLVPATSPEMAPCSQSPQNSGWWEFPYRYQARGFGFQGFGRSLGTSCGHLWYPLMEATA